MLSIYDISYADLLDFCKSLALKAYRAQQIWQGLYIHYYQTPDEHVQLPKKIRLALSSEYSFSPLVPIKQLVSSDRKTIKTIFKLWDGKTIEAVLMLYNRRKSLCISTQVGCALGCKFCATGQMGFSRNLTMGEIVHQVMYYANLVKATNDSISNIVFMGMGEPFHNYFNTMAAIDRLNDHTGFCFGERRMTISTVGIIPGIKRFTREKRQVNLAISLHSADDTLRKEILPIAKKYPVDELLDACREYTIETKRRITFECTLISGVNDTPEQASLLVKKICGLLCHVNLIPLNPTAGYGGQVTTREKAINYCNIVQRAGIPCSIRLRRGVEIWAGCGQLETNET